MIYLASRICYYVVFWVMEYHVDVSYFLFWGLEKEKRDEEREKGC
jgi:hypothetical protein